jgi:methylenetetrahydrofolate reductase (NADPH)
VLFLCGAVIAVSGDWETARDERSQHERTSRSLPALTASMPNAYIAAPAVPCHARSSLGINTSGPEMTSTPPRSVSSLQQLLRAGQFVMTAEIAPPVSCDAGDLMRKALPLRGLADAVNVTDGASARAHLSPTIAAALLVREGIEPILQLTCRDRNRIALQAELMGAAACNVRNVLCLTGDDPKAGDQPETKAVFDIDSTALTRMARELRDKGELPSGRKVGGVCQFFLGAADLPIDPPPGWQPDKLAVKAAAGAEFVQTQFCMDAQIVRHYAGRLAEHAPTSGLYLLIGIASLRSAKSARWMRHHLFGTIIPDRLIERLERAADPAAEGERICVELIEELAHTPGVAGVHIMAPANENAVPKVIAEARRRLPKKSA